MIKKSKIKSYYPRGFKKRIAEETKLSYPVVVDYFKGREVSLDSREKIEAVKDKYLVKPNVA